MTQTTLPLTSAPNPSADQSAKRTDVDDRAPPAPTKPAEPQAAPKAVAKPGGRRRRVSGWMLALGGGLIAVAAYFYVPRLYFVETDDAAFQADTVSVMPKVAAYVSALYVSDNTAFSAGQLLVELDPRDFQVAVDNAAAALQSAQAAQADAEAQLGEQSQIIASDQANVQGDRAVLAFATQQLTRFDVLSKAGVGSTERFQQAQSDIGERQAAVQKDVATLSAAEAQVGVLQSQLGEAKANVARAEAVLAQAKLNLSYTRIYAPTTGTVANRSVEVGNFVQPGQTLFSAVPNESYIIANFRETQLTDMKVGQPVTIRVDAYPALRLHGHIDSFQHGTGSDFALLPPENATGNFVKIVQRVPVKIVLDDADQGRHLLAPGMSVEATVMVHAPPRWLAPFL